jgi:predicted kinase
VAGAPVIVIIRGNSASGKSTIAARIRELNGPGIAIVSQDLLRRVVLKEKDQPGAVNIGLIDAVARYALGSGYHVIIEGILYQAHYGTMLTALREDLPGRCHFWYLDVPFAQTLSRHATKPQAAEYGEAELRAWWRDRDFLLGGFEQVITAGESAENAAARIMAGAGLTPIPHRAA